MFIETESGIMVSTPGGRMYIGIIFSKTGEPAGFFFKMVSP
jgi:hypothetical protein